MEAPSAFESVTMTFCKVTSILSHCSAEVVPCDFLAKSVVETRTGANASPSVEISCVSCALTESIDVTPKFSRMIPVTLTLAPLGKARTTLDGDVVRTNRPE